MASPSALSRCVVSPTGKHTASLIFLHGSGDSGQGIKSWIREILKQDLAFEHIKVIFPTAPAQPYTPMMGEMSNVWFDRYKISMDSCENLESVDSMCQILTNLINDEVKTGIAKNRILLGGFSMGGAMAMHLAYRFHRDVAGVFALSGFLNKDSVVYKEIKEVKCRLPELFQWHGNADTLVLPQWGEETNKILKSLGVTTTFHSSPNMYHELNLRELHHLKAWILKQLPTDFTGAQKSQVL
ncbi:lysophospholipase-like protein 1 [Pelobates fuscus]|uniref:lysophospholipase-like protein 1 n=1 Tax=Pelobates fuscus TaxID=191477 RepID=UPI002FE47B51